jgi:hypothetical protein
MTVEEFDALPPGKQFAILDGPVTMSPHRFLESLGIAEGRYEEDFVKPKRKKKAAHA